MQRLTRTTQKHCQASIQAMAKGNARPYRMVSALTCPSTPNPVPAHRSFTSTPISALRSFTPRATLIGSQTRAYASVTAEPSGPLVSLSLFPDFAAINEEDILPTLESLLAEVDAAFTNAEASFTPTWKGSLGLIEHLEWRLEYALGIVNHLSGVRDTPAVRDALRAIQPRMVQLGLRIGQSRPLYRAIHAQLEPTPNPALDPVQLRILQDRLTDMRTSGIDLPEGSPEAKRFAFIKEKLAELSLSFGNHVLDAVKSYAKVITDPAHLAGCPPSLLAALAHSSKAHGHPEATPEAGPWTLTLEQPILSPFMESCTYRPLREELYRANITKAPANVDLIPQILSLRHEMAQLIGCKDYAALSRMSKMAKAGPEPLLEGLYTSVIAPAKKELDSLSTYAAAHLDLSAPLRPWDVPYAREALRRSETRFSEEEISLYFPFDHVIQGMFRLAHNLFGISVSQVTSEEMTTLGATSWHEDVRLYKVQEAGKTIAYFYGDFYSRPENKRPGAWMDVCSTRRTLQDGSERIPVAYLVCNQPRPQPSTGVSLMKFNDVLTLFHEFGHCLQHMLTRVPHPQASGIHGIEWDFVEVASQLMENFCYEPATLSQLSSHHTTGEPMPADMMDALAKERRFMAGMDTLRQLQFSTVDLVLHGAPPAPGQGPFDVDREVSKRFTLIPRIPEDRFLCSFSHIFGGGYSAGYYSYKWSEVYAADGYAAFEEAGTSQEARRTVGKTYRDTVLALGGGTDPNEVWKRFRGTSDVSVHPLLRHQGLE